MEGTSESELLAKLAQLLEERTAPAVPGFDMQPGPTVRGLLVPVNLPTGNRGYLLVECEGPAQLPAVQSQLMMSEWAPYMYQGQPFRGNYGGGYGGGGGGFGDGWRGGRRGWRY